MENKDNSNLTSWLNEFYKKTDCLSFFYNQLTFKIANDLKEYQSNFNFILQELSFFLVLLQISIVKNFLILKQNINYMNLIKLIKW